MKANDSKNNNTPETLLRKRYFEVNISDARNKKDESLIMIGYRQPTVQEAEKFLAEDIVHTYKCDHIVDIFEVTEEYAHSMYDLEDESNIPVFGKI